MFDGYREEELIGEGGLGRVYRAVRESTGGVVAIKMLRDVQDSSPAWHRANRELEAMLRVKGHPYVVTVEEIFLGPDGPCLVMEFLPGGSIGDLRDAGAFTTPEIVLIGQHVSQALVAAHEVGIVHRDIKPQNLMVGGFGQVKVGDFGISALARGDEQTKTAALTLAYASPEELDGDERVGPAADVFSLAATLHHLITGNRPTFSARVHGWPSLRSTDDPALEPVIDALEAGLHHDAAARPTMMRFSAAFDEAARLLGDDAIRQLARRPGTAWGAGATTGDSSAASPAQTIGRTDESDSAPRDLGLHPAVAADETMIRAPGSSASGSSASVSWASAVASGRRPLLIGATVTLGVAAVVGAILIGGGGGSNDGADDRTTVSVATSAEGAEGAEGASVGALATIDGSLGLGILVPETGEMSGLANAPTVGARAAIDEIDAAGGVLGNPIVVTMFDSGSSEAIARTRLAEMDAAGVDVIIGPISDEAAFGIVDPAIESGRLVITPASTSNEPGEGSNGMYVRLVATDVQHGELIGRLMVESGATAVAFVGLDEASSTALRSGARAVVEAAGGDVVFEDSYPIDDPENDEAGAAEFAMELAAEIVASRPEALLIAGFDEDTALLIDALAPSGGGSVPFSLFGTDANTGGDLASMVADPAALDGMVGTFVTSAPSEFNERIGLDSDDVDPSNAAEAYDAVVVAALGAQAAGSDDPSMIAAVIPQITSGGTPCESFAECAELLTDGVDIDYVGQSGSVDVTADGTVANPQIIVLAYDASSNFAFVRTIELT